MPWQKVGERQYERPMGPREQALFLLGASAYASGHTDWILSGTVTLNKNTDAERLIPRLRDAWIKLRFEHPSIGNRVKDLSKFVYHVPGSSSDLDAWMQESFFVDPEAPNAEALYGKLGVYAGHALYVLPRSKEVVVVAGHYHSDGRAALWLVNRVLELSVDPSAPPPLPWGQEVSRLLVSLEEIARMPTDATPAQMEKIQDAVRGFLKLDSPRSMTLANPPTSPAGPSQRVRMVLSEAETAQALERCKSRGVSINSVIQAVLAVENMKNASPEERSRIYQMAYPRDLRSRLPAPYNDLKTSASGYMVTSRPACLPAHGTFETFLEALEHYRKTGFDEETFRMESVYFQSIAQSMMKLPADYTTAHDCDFSAMGKMEDIIAHDYNGEMFVESAEMSVNSYSPAIGSWAWTYKGRLTLFLSFNEGYRSRAAMEAFLQQVLATLRSELGTDAND